VSHGTQLESPIESIACPHELRPGTAVCLHCRREARTAARARRRRLYMKGGAGVALLSTLGVVALVARVAIFGHDLVPGMRVATATVTTDDGGDAVPKASPSAAAQQGATRAAALRRASAAAPNATTSAGATVVPVVPQGQSILPDSLVATRADSVITVWFDRTMIRTRNPWKFERLVRRTLPALYGSLADSALARIPEGGLARQGDLLNELPTRGLRIPAAPGLTFSLYPITRPGQDGPLVIQYRVSLIRG